MRTSCRDGAAVLRWISNVDSCGRLIFVFDALRSEGHQFTARRMSNYRRLRTRRITMAEAANCVFQVNHQRRQAGADRESLSTQFCQFAPDFAFAFGQLFRHVDLNNNVEVATFSGDTRQAALAQTKPLSTLCA
jgi:hypothetical protein